MLVISIDICDLLVDVTKLHMVLVHLVVVDYLIDLLDPLIIQEHRIVALCYDFLSAYKLIILGFHAKPQCLHIRFLFKPPFTST